MKRAPKKILKYRGRLQKPKTGFFEKSEPEKSALFKHGASL